MQNFLRRGVLVAVNDETKGFLLLVFLLFFGGDIRCFPVDLAGGPTSLCRIPASSIGGGFITSQIVRSAGMGAGPPGATRRSRWR